MDEEIARLRAEMDQAREGMKDYAKTLWAFYSEATDEGFTPEQALDLTLQLMRSLWAGQDGGE